MSLTRGLTIIGKNWQYSINNVNRLYDIMAYNVNRFLMEPPMEVLVLLIS
jgi:hypothetical protein